jgi:hypothetical protein
MPSKRATSAYSECNRVEADTYRQSACNLGLVSSAKRTPLKFSNNWIVSINESHEIVDFSTWALNLVQTEISTKLFHDITIKIRAQPSKRNILSERIHHEIGQDTSLPIRVLLP